MKVTMKRYEHLAIENAKRYTKNWDYFCIAVGSFLTGYRAAKDDAEDAYHNHDVERGDIPLDSIGEQPIECEFKDGDQQLSLQSFSKWKKETQDLPFKEALKVFLPYYDFTDLRVDVDSKGVVSFQGTCKKNVEDYKGYNDNG